MKKNKFITLGELWCFIILICCSCSSRARFSNIANFDAKDTINPRVSYIDCYSTQADLIILTDCYIVQNDIKTNGYQLSVYSKNTNNHLYDFAMRGHGPEETIAMDIFQNPKHNIIEIIDQSKYKVLKYQVSDKTASLISENFLKLPNIGPLQEVYRHNDSIIVFNTLDSRLFSYNDIKNEVICEINFADSLGLSKGTFEKMNYHLAYYNSKIYLGFRHFNLLAGGNIDANGGIHMDDFSKIKKMSENADENIFHYIYVDMSDKYIMAQYMGYAPGFVQKIANEYRAFNPKFDIEIYSNQMKPYKHIVPSVDILRCKLDKEKNTIYSWNPMDSKGNILMFDF